MTQVIGRADEFTWHWRKIQQSQPLGGKVIIQLADGRSARPLEDEYASDSCMEIVDDQGNPTGEVRVIPLD